MPIQQLDEIAAALEYRLGEAAQRTWGYTPHVGAALLSIYTHHEELLVDGETLEEVDARVAPITATRPGGATVGAGDS